MKSVLIELQPCLYLVDLAQLGGLACLGEIYSSLRNSYKNVFIWEASQPVGSHLMGSHLILPRSHLGETKSFHMNTRKWASPARRDSMARRSVKKITCLHTKYFFDAASSCFCWHEILFCATSTRFCRHQITFCATSNFLFQHKNFFRGTPNFCSGHR